MSGWRELLLEIHPVLAGLREREGGAPERAVRQPVVPLSLDESTSRYPSADDQD